MADLTITEYSNLCMTDGQAVPVGQEPALAIQHLAIGASVASAAFNAQTRFIRVQAAAICAIVFNQPGGSDPTAVAATSSRMAAESTEYFGVRPNQKLAVVTST